MIILGRVDSTLSSDGVRAARRILVTKTFHAVAELAQSRCGRTAGETAPDYDDFEFAAIVRTNETGMVFVTGPLAIEWTRRNPRLEIADHNCWAGLMIPSKTAIGIEV